MEFGGGQAKLVQPVPGAVSVVELRQGDLDVVGAAVDHHQTVHVAVLGPEQDLDHPVAGVVPRLGRHGVAVRTEPVEVGLLVAHGVVMRLAGQELLAQPDDALGGAQHGMGFRGAGPVNPRDRVVLAVGVVVALLGPADLVPCRNHGDALGDHQAGHQVLPALGAPGKDVAVFGGALETVVVAAVVAVAVAVLLAVGLVVFAVVAVRSASVKPSWAVMKFSEASRDRPEGSNSAAEPERASARRAAGPPIPPASIAARSASQKLRTASRK